MTQKSLLIFMALLVGVGLLFYAIFIRTNKKDRAPLQGTTIVAFGDSLVRGVGADESTNFVTVLSQMIGEPIVNLGVSGNTTVDGLARLEDVIDKDPKVVLVLLGGNDFLRRIPLAQTFENLNTIVTTFEAKGIRVILLGVRGGLLSDQYEEHFEKLVGEKDLYYVSDVLDGLFGKDEYMSDAIHPNSTGYKKIAERIYPVLKSALTDK